MLYRLEKDRERGLRQVGKVRRDEECNEKGWWIRRCEKMRAFDDAEAEFDVRIRKADVRLEEQVERDWTKKRRWMMHRAKSWVDVVQRWWMTRKKRSGSAEGVQKSFRRRGAFRRGKGMASVWLHRTRRCKRKKQEGGSARISW